MNVLYIYTGEYYAVAEGRPNKTFWMHARKGKALQVQKVKPYGAERATPYVTFEMEDGSKHTVRSRDVIDFWDSYEKERQAILDEREEQHRISQEQHAALALEREESNRLRREAQEAQERLETEKREKLINALVARTGLPRHLIVEVSLGYVTLDRLAIEMWLSTQENANQQLADILAPLKDDAQKMREILSYPDDTEYRVVGDFHPNG